MESCVHFSGLGPGGWRRGRRGSRRGRGRARTPCGRSGEVRPPQPLLHEARLEVRLRVRGVLHRRLRVPLGETSDTSPPSLSSATSPPHRSVRARPRGRPRAPAPPPRRSAPRRGGGSAPRPDPRVSCRGSNGSRHKLGGGQKVCMVQGVPVVVEGGPWRAPPPPPPPTREPQPQPPEWVGRRPARREWVW